MAVAVDTNVILDVLLADPNFLESSQHLLSTHMHQNLIISEVVYAELATAFPEQVQLDHFLRDVHITMTTMTKRGLWIASRAWRACSQRRNTGLLCPSCGYRQEYACHSCTQTLTSRQHVLADFLIAGHALEHECRLLSRDRGFYRTFFPDLVILE